MCPICPSEGTGLLDGLSRRNTLIMLMRHMRMPSGPILPRLATWSFGLSLCVLVCWLLHRMLFEGQASSYDSMIYTRGLWGLANGEHDNPVRGLPFLANHGNFVLFLFSPFTHLFHAANVLIGAQGIALAALVVLIAKTVEGAGQTAQLSAWHRTGRGLGLAIMATLCTPLILNPFLFGARPDLIGVPLVTAGLLRAERRKGFDCTAIWIMIPAILVREEYAGVIAAALVLAPSTAPDGLNRRKLWMIAVCCGLYFVGYWLLFRPWLLAEPGGHGFWGYVARGVVTVNSERSLDIDVGALLTHKAHLLAILLFSIGGLAAVGWRWGGAALPGIVLLLLQIRRNELTMSTHYVRLLHTDHPK